MDTPIKISERFPASRERTVLLELLHIVKTLRDDGIEVVVCGGWVPFLKELSQRSDTGHSMSLDIDLVLPEATRSPGNVKRVKARLFDDLAFGRSRESSCKLEKFVNNDLVQLDLLADVAGSRNDDPIIKVYGEGTSLDLARLDGGRNLFPHIEEITIAHEDTGGIIRQSRITIPNSVGFLMLKGEVTLFRQKAKDPYDIYYYCRHCDAPANIREKFMAASDAPGVRSTIQRLQYLFQYPDSMWVELALDHAKVVGSERDREAQRIVRTISSVIAGLM